MKTDEYGVQYSDDGKILLDFPKELEGEYIIPDGVEVIESCALYAYHVSLRPKLSSLRISKSVTEIGYSAGFKWLDSIIIDEGNPVYDSRANCNAIIETKTNKLLVASKHAFIPDGVKIIGERAFDETYEESKLYIPASVEEIDEQSFDGTAVGYIEVDKSNKFFDSRDNCNAIIETKTNRLVLGSTHSVIPNGVCSIGVGAFENCRGIEKLVIPESVYSIEEFAFESAQIGELYIPKSVEQIYLQAFAGNEIERIFVDSENQSYYVQGNCVVSRGTARLKFTGLNYEIPRGVKIIGSFSLTASDNGAIVIPDGVEEIMAQAFLVESGKLRLKLPSSVKLIYSLFLSEDRVEEIVVPKGQKERFSRMKFLAHVKHLIVEAEE